MINGERSPVRDPNASGVFFGIRRSTVRADLYRSVLEGVAYGMLSIREVMQEVFPSGLKMQELCLTGGGAKSGLWAQIFADVMDCKVNVLRSPEDVGVKGMAIIAGKALGWYSSYLPAEQLGFEKTFLPGANAAVYRKTYTLYKELYPSLKSVFLRSAQIMN
jgi:xylulokinase